MNKADNIKKVINSLKNKNGKEFVYLYIEYQFYKIKRY